MLFGFEIDKELQKSEQLIRELERKQTRKRFNIIITLEPASSNWTPKRHCIHHPGTRLIPIEENGVFVPDLLQCPECGSQYGKDEAPREEDIRSKHGQTKPRIISAKSRKKKKYQDSRGNDINSEDKDIVNLIAQGYQIKYYHEEVPKK